MTEAEIAAQATTADGMANELDTAADGVHDDELEAGMLRAMASAYRTFAQELRNLIG